MKACLQLEFSVLENLWRKPNLTLIKLVPSLGDDTPSLNSLLPILLELTSFKNETIITPTSVSTLHQTTHDELTLAPVLIPRLQIALHLHQPQL